MRLSQSQLQESYKKAPNTLSLNTENHAYAYLATRMPATYKVLKRCFSELPLAFCPERVLDLGTGPGTGLWACLDHFKNISQLHAYDAHMGLLTMAQTIAENFNISNITFDHGRLEDFVPKPNYDLVLLNYVLNEFSKEKAWEIAKKAFQSTQGFLIITLPGTPRDFQLLLYLRQSFIDQCFSETRATILAPCPHHGKCPLQEKDWCHFSVRLQRTNLHKALKNGTLGYEDEKFCYLILGYEPKGRSKRIIKPTQHRKGHISLPICTETGLEENIIVSKKSSDFKKMKKKMWGDLI